MRVQNNLYGLHDQVGAIAMGMFDGMHLGHSLIVDTALQLAKETGKYSAVLTFHPHPAEALGIAVRLLTSPTQRRSLVAARGIDVLVELPFTREFSTKTPSAFVEVIAQHFGTVHLVVGFNFSFGHKAEGTAQLLRELGAPLGIAVHELPAVELKGETISSTRIRALIERGDLMASSECLGRIFSLQGTVVRGDGRGRVLGFPTANLSFSYSPVLPPFGVYLVRSSKYGYGVGNLGVRPTFPLSVPTCEVFFFDDLPKSLYDEVIEVGLLTFLREERRFFSPEDLRSQVLEDIKQARAQAVTKNKEEDTIKSHQSTVPSSS